MKRAVSCNCLLRKVDANDCTVQHAAAFYRSVSVPIWPKQRVAYSTLKSYHVSSHTDWSEVVNGAHCIFPTAVAAASSRTLWPELVFTLIAPTRPVANSSKRSVVRTGFEPIMDRAALGKSVWGRSHLRSGPFLADTVLFRAFSKLGGTAQATRVTKMTRISIRICVA